ncbi:MAG: hypothetical protein SPI25_04355 [Dialister sp.]|nr:hypothetical protein [Dialister sp.]
MMSELATWMGDIVRTVHINAICNLPDNAAIMIGQKMGYFFRGDSMPFLDERRIVFRPLSPALGSKTVLAWRRN